MVFLAVRRVIVGPEAEGVFTLFGISVDGEGILGMAGAFVQAVLAGQRGGSAGLAGACRNSFGVTPSQRLNERLKLDSLV